MEGKALKIALVVAAYFCVSLSMVFTNKALMSGSATIPAPMFVTWFQCVVTVVICWVLGRLGRDAAPGSFLAQFPEFTYDLAIARKVMKLSVMFVGMITFNNLCLKYVEVSFYTVARSLAICFNVVFSYFVLHQETSRETLVCLAVVVFGFYLGTEGEVHFSFAGSVFGILSSCFVSLNSIFTKGVSPLVDNNKWRLAAYNNMNAVLMFIPLMFIQGEFDVIAEHSDLLLSAQFWALMFLGGVFGFLIGIVSILQITITSPLTHNISGTAKAACQSVLAFYIFQNPTTAQNMAGIAITLIGTLSYSYVRRREMKRADAEAAARAVSESVVQLANRDSSKPADTAKV